MTAHASNKEVKLGEDGCIGDMISNLPDEILTHLLSFMSTREAVRTSTLSTRWKYVWRSVPILNLNEMHFYISDILKIGLTQKSRARFSNFLDRALLDRTMPCIETATILGHSEHDSSRIKSWICAAINQNVHELDLEVECNLQIPLDELTRASFSSSKLVVLKLCTDMIVNFPETSICFPNLKVLELREVRYKDDDSAQNLISSCPVLEDLVIERCDSDNLVTWNVTSRMLKNLKVICREESEDHVKKVVIDASALESIDFLDFATQEYYLVRSLQSLIKAKLHIYNFSAFRDVERFGICLVELLQKIWKVKFLLFSSYTMLSLSHTQFNDLPNFQNLTCFELYTRTNVKRISWKLMMKILDSSPMLENLIFWGLKFSWDGETGTLHRDVAKCLQSSLKTIKIIRLRRVSHLRKVSYFLENAKVLEKMIIDNGMWDEGFKLEVAQNLSEVRKGSMACQFHLC